MRYSEAVLSVLLSLAVLGLCGCFSSNPEDVRAFDRPKDKDVTAETYILEPPDEITVMASRIPQLHEQAQVIRPDGKVSFEDVGDIQVAGKTPREVAGLLYERMSELYALSGENPIDVRISDFQSKLYFVIGQVAFPGAKVFSGRETTLSAIAKAVPTPIAWEERIQVIRPSVEACGKPKIFEVNFDHMAAHGDMSGNVLLQEGDIIFVPPTVLGAIGLTVSELLRPVRGMSGIAGAGLYY